MASYTEAWHARELLWGEMLKIKDFEGISLERTYCDHADWHLNVHSLSNCQFTIPSEFDGVPVFHAGDIPSNVPYPKPEEPMPIKKYIEIKPCNAKEFSRIAAYLGEHHSGDDLIVYGELWLDPEEYLQMAQVLLEPHKDKTYPVMPQNVTFELKTEKLTFSECRIIGYTWGDLQQIMLKFQAYNVSLNGVLLWGTSI